MSQLKRPWVQAQTEVGPSLPAEVDTKSSDASVRRPSRPSRIGQERNVRVLVDDVRQNTCSRHSQAGSKRSG